ncbi:MAG: hypothetical protein LBU68_01350 [Rickettsiales bacterium]|jgi:hypothetical protein|nr:hypothetical protein [Rickettsiales bacterium]
MSNKCIQFRRGNTAEHKEFTGLSGEITVDTDKKTVVVHDEKTAGGIALAREDLSNVSTEILIKKVDAAKTDLSNVASEIIMEKGFAKSDLTNIDAQIIIDKGIAKSDLTNVDAATITNKGIAKNDLSNIIVSENSIGFFTTITKSADGTQIAVEYFVDAAKTIRNAIHIRGVSPIIAAGANMQIDYIKPLFNSDYPVLSGFGAYGAIGEANIITTNVDTNYFKFTHGMAGSNKRVIYDVWSFNV